MNAMVKAEVMNWDRFSIEDWLKQYGAYIQISRMKSGNQPDSLGVNQIYWLILENNKGMAPRKDQVICQINDFEAEQVRKLIVDFNKSSSVCESGKRAVQLFVERNVRGLSDRKMEEEFKLGRNVLRNMIYAGKFYLAGHDKRLRIE
ncbi:hypothetical protein F891_01895 [Acinetobacter sp. CIP 101966]|uniref:hypothetical protein n=1 Tax=Acinetobacter sp. CIP 101966 TaxID=1144662 RepID=UPI0002D0F5A2|nr:hypothetical protein [Acinetobacter sp. CIP 101966]ENX26942.1 hypothetical protein F891_01895 [Acinetobacter sp. CIP 101966]